MKPFEEYKPSLKYPTTIHNIVKPKLVDYNNHTEHGIALDQYETDILEFKAKRAQLYTEYSCEEAQKMNLFWNDLFDDMDWNDLTHDQKQRLEVYLWDRGHAEGFPSIVSEAFAVEELLNAFIK